VDREPGGRVEGRSNLIVPVRGRAASDAVYLSMSPLCVRGNWVTVAGKIVELPPKSPKLPVEGATGLPRAMGGAEVIDTLSITQRYSPRRWRDW